MNIVEFPRCNVGDIPNGLRKLADIVESGPEAGVVAVSDATSVVWIGVNQHGEVTAGCVGQEADRFKLAGIMQKAAIQLLTGGDS